MTLSSGPAPGTPPKRAAAVPHGLAARLSAGRAALAATWKEVTALYEIPADEFLTEKSGVSFVEPSGKGEERLVRVIARKVLRNESFVVAVGGMSDVAGHGNRHFDSYPEVSAKRERVRARGRALRETRAAGVGRAAFL